MLSQIAICIWARLPAILQDCEAALSSDRYQINSYSAADALLDYVQSHREQIDCLILAAEPDLADLIQQLCRQAIVVPALILGDRDVDSSDDATSCVYHNAELHLGLHQLDQLPYQVDAALAKFLRQAPVATVAEQAMLAIADHEPELSSQQRLLAGRLRERLGYLGVYYKRDPSRFLQSLASDERQKLRRTLEASYREIILSYFTPNSSINQNIDNFVNTAFFADVPVTQVVEIHMELMDQFSTKLRVEGRSEDILLDYRLTLIDVIAHLCEMYRRSIPRET